MKHVFMCITIHKLSSKAAQEVLETMETTIVFLKLTLVMMFLALAPSVKCQFLLPPPHPPAPLCSSQFALANHACEMIPYKPIPPPSPPSPPSLSSTPPDNGTHRHDHKHRHEHEHTHGQEHGHRHRHHRHGSHVTPVEENCCRWLKDLDTECVCDLLVLLPAFLARPAHTYSVAVGSACAFTFQCAGRLRA